MNNLRINNFNNPISNVKEYYNNDHNDYNDHNEEDVEVDRCSISSNEYAISEDANEKSDEEGDKKSNSNSYQTTRVYLPSIIPVQNVETQKDAIERKKLELNNILFKIKLSNCIEIRKIEMSILNESNLRNDFFQLNSIILTIIENLYTYNAQIEKEDEKKKMISTFEGQFTDPNKTCKELYFLKKEYNKKIIAINNIIENINNNIKTCNDELNNYNIQKDKIKTEITSISQKKLLIAQRKNDFDDYLIKCNEYINIEVQNFKLSKYIIIRCDSKYTNDRYVEFIENNKPPTIPISCSSTFSDGNDLRSSSPVQFRTMERPIAPSMNKPVLLEYSPLIATISKNYKGTRKPCIHGTICHYEKCGNLHPKGYHYIDAAHNKAELNNLNNFAQNKYKQEKYEYNYIWNKYKSDLNTWETLESLKNDPILDIQSGAVGD